MRRPRIAHLVGIAAVLCAGVVLASAARDDDFKIIVNPGNPVTEVDRQFLRDAYLRKASSWDSGAMLRPIDLAPRFAVRERFVHSVLKKSPSQLKSYWNQKIFSGTGVPPPEAETTAGVVAYVLANPGGVGYLPVEADAGDAKVVRVK